MLTKKLIIENDRGLHARPSALIVEKILPFKCNVKITCNKVEADAKSVLSLLSLIAQKGFEVEIVIDGENEIEAMKVMIDLFHSKFKEAY